MAEDVLERWLRAVAEDLDASISGTATGWRLEGTGEGWKQFVVKISGPEKKPAQKKTVRREPRNLKEWRDRLRLVEKHAAATLNDAPVGFTATFPGRRESRVVRFAFGFSLSLGYPLRKRFTAHFAIGKGQASLIAGDDGLFAAHPSISALDPTRAEWKAALPHLSSAAADAQKAYLSDAAVVAEVARIRKRYSSDVQCLETLYIANWGQDARLLGTAAKHLTGDDAIEAEYVTRLEDLIDRYRPAAMFTPLSIGIIEGAPDRVLRPSFRKP